MVLYARPFLLRLVAHRVGFHPSSCSPPDDPLYFLPSGRPPTTGMGSQVECYRGDFALVLRDLLI